MNNNIIIILIIFFLFVMNRNNCKCKNENFSQNDAEYKCKKMYDEQKNKKEGNIFPTKEIADAPSTKKEFIMSCLTTEPDCFRKLLKKLNKCEGRANMVCHQKTMNDIMTKKDSCMTKKFCESQGDNKEKCLEDYKYRNCLMKKNPDADCKTYVLCESLGVNKEKCYEDDKYRNCLMKKNKDADCWAYLMQHTK
jgi:hypothetical protein